MSNISYCGYNMNNINKNKKGIVPFDFDAQSLIKKLSKAKLKFQSSGIDYDAFINSEWVIIENQAENIIDYGERNYDERGAIAQLRRAKTMAQLKDWQKDIVEKVREKEETLEIHFTQKGNEEYVYVISSDASFNKMEEYSNLYYDVLDNNPDCYFELLVFDEREKERISLSENSSSIIL